MTRDLFPTTVIGSLPRPACVRDLILDRKKGIVTHDQAREHLDDEIKAAIHLQEGAGLDEITDGEWRRESYVKVFAERVHGFAPDINPGAAGLNYPAVIAPIESSGAIAAHEVQFLKKHTGRRIKCTLPSPYIIGRRMWHSDHSTSAYPTREALMRDCVPILRREIVAIREAGAATVQLDEPWLSAMVDSRFREREGISAPHYQMDLCADLINQTVSGITGIDTAIHLCHAHFNRRHVSEGEYDLIMPTLAKIRVGTISMEYATPVSGGYSALSKFPDGVRLGLGCVDHCDRRVETPQVVVDRVERAMRYIDRDRITLHPDCGFAPSVQNPMDLDEACQKLKAMCEAAAILRSRYG
ncbi:MAG: cobalamin-independent methionine synthase II family protein [Pirellulaceae bacterium]|nr:cobalamin-independent methionine synthase II family protein [Pirellulaceae bacterium]